MSVANMFKNARVWFTNLFKTKEEIQKGVLENELKEIIERKNREEEEKKGEGKGGNFM